MPTELLSIQPSELKFPFELKKQVSCSLRLVNLTEHYVAYKVKTTSPKKYCVRPNTGVVLPQSSVDITVTMQVQREAPPDLQCKDKFLIQSVIAPYGISAKDVSQELFNKEPGKDICETKLRAVFVPPPQPPSPVLESAEEGLSPKSSYSLDNGDQSTFFTDTARAALTSLTEERNAALRKTQLLQQELAQVLASKSKAETTQSQQKFSFMFVIIVAILSFVLGILIY
ncbi:vesicle-associated protein 1-2 isoform X2 [Cryptomeria japonica]|uniref:vesicle-associated protein 1-2 isoform X2 n=1 Tax=Cryptomeria japonica TaxID=3369 RepID=UPI0027DA6FE0|nr:vesicle-associated protein 1-2 isoform X2 [Cryptomeria japonica]